MQGHVVLRNRLQVGIVDDLQRRDIDDALQGGLELRRGELVIEPRLDGGIEDLFNEDPENGLNDPGQIPHLVPGPVVVHVEPELVAPNPPLQQLQLEQNVLQAMWIVLGGPVPYNAITGPVLFQALRRLRRRLPARGPYRLLAIGPYWISRDHVEFATILRWVARMMTIPTVETYMSGRRDPSLDFETMLQAMVKTMPECPLGYHETLDNLCMHLLAAASVMPKAEGIFVFKDRDEFGAALCSLATRLTAVE